MIIRVHGVNFFNKGAELMLLAVQSEIQKAQEGGIVACNLHVGSFRDRERAGVHHLMERQFNRLPWLQPVMDMAVGSLPERLRRQMHLVGTSEVDAVLDASGFAYGDQWSIARVQRAARDMQQWQKRGQKVILLPQAFGPFERPEMRAAMGRILAAADLVFARDQTSYDHLVRAFGPADNLRLAPDFTNLVPGLLPAYAASLRDRPCLIPNSRMIDKGDKKEQAHYVSFLRQSVHILRDLGLEPFILLHTGRLEDDLGLSQSLQSSLESPVEIVEETNPQYIKGLIGQSSLVISSRYHGLVSALSQNVPALGTSWSHKYQELFDEYEFPVGLISATIDQMELRERFEMMLRDRSRAELLAGFERINRSRQQEVRAMWESVHALLGR